MKLDLNDSQLERYSRHILLPEIGAIGQVKLMASKVLIVGAGGLGAPMILSRLCRYRPHRNHR